MSDLQRLKAAGASCVGGDLFIGHTKVGILRGSQCIITPEGEEALARTAAAEAPAATPAPTSTAKSAKGRKAEAKVEPPAPAPAPASDPTAGLDDLLRDGE